MFYIKEPDVEKSNPLWRHDQFIKDEYVWTLDYNFSEGWGEICYYYKFQSISDKITVVLSLTLSYKEMKNVFDAGLSFKSECVYKNIIEEYMNVINLKSMENNRNQNKSNVLSKEDMKQLPVDKIISIYFFDNSKENRDTAFKCIQEYNS